MKNTKISGTIGGASRDEHLRANSRMETNFFHEGSENINDQYLINKNGEQQKNFEEDDEEENHDEELEQECGGNTDGEQEYDRIGSSLSNSMSSKGSERSRSNCVINKQSRSRNDEGSQNKEQQLEFKRRKLSLGTPTTSGSKVAAGAPSNSFQVRFQHKVSDLLKKVPLCDQDTRIIRFESKT